MLVYEFNAGLPVDKDVVERLLAIFVNDEFTQEKSYPANTSHFGEFAFNQNDSVRIELRDKDDAGNWSEPGVFEFTALDTIPPSAPGGLGVVLLREEYDS